MKARPNAMLHSLRDEFLFLWKRDVLVTASPAYLNQARLALSLNEIPSTVRLKHRISPGHFLLGEDPASVPSKPLYYLYVPPRWLEDAQAVLRELPGSHSS